MNCGDWVESCTALAEHADGRFEIITWFETGFESPLPVPRLIEEEEEEEAEIAAKAVALKATIATVPGSSAFIGRTAEDP